MKFIVDLRKFLLLQKSLTNAEVFTSKEAQDRLDQVSDQTLITIATSDKSWGVRETAVEALKQKGGIKLLLSKVLS